MVYKVFKATMENPIKKDFVQDCVKYLSILKIEMKFDEIEKLSNFTFKKLVKEKVSEIGLEYLLREKNKQKKISHLKFKRLEIQEYFLLGNSKISKFIFKARSKTLEIKTHKKWKFKDTPCTGCQEREETEDEILTCPRFGEITEKVSYKWFYGKSVKNMVMVAKILIKKLKLREKMLQEVT